MFVLFIEILNNNVTHYFKAIEQVTRCNEASMRQNYSMQINNKIKTRTVT